MRMSSNPTEQGRPIHRGEAIFSACLALASLGVAAWALQAAHWLNPNPSFLLVMVLGVSWGAVSALTNMKQGLAFVLIICGSIGISVLQSIIALPAIESGLWPQWLTALTKPANDPTVFIMILTMIIWLAGAFGAWYAVRRRNGWVAFILGSLIVVLNLVNLPRDFAYVLPLYLFLGLALIIQAGWLHVAAGKVESGRRIRFIPGMILCLFIVFGAFTLPQAPAERFSLNIDAGTLYSAIKNNGLNIFEAVPSKVKTILSSGQDQVDFVGSPDLGDTIRFTISASIPGYYATHYYDTYSSAGWSNSPLTELALQANQSIEDASQSLKTTLIRYDVENEIKTDLILINGRAEVLSIAAIARTLPATKGLDVASLTSSKLLSPYTPYSVTARISTATANDLIAGDAAYPSWVTDRYLQLPVNLPRSIRTISQQLTRGIDAPTMGSLTYNKIVAIENYLHNFAYDIDGTIVPGNTDGVAAFLSSKEGNCVNFASALVVMLRAAGVPARFVQGYLGSEVDPDGKHLLIYGRNSHAWAEVYFPDYGWIVVESTPGSPEDKFTGLSFTTPGQIIPPETEITPSPTPENPAPEDTGSQGNQIPGSPIPLIIFGFLGGLVLISSGGTFFLRRASRPDIVYARLVWLGNLFRVASRKTETPAEYAYRLSRRLPKEASDITFIAGAFARSRYGPEKSIERAAQAELAWKWKKLSLRLLKSRFGFG
jgi:hypothetical protein